MIECNNKFLSEFQRFLSSKYKELISHIDNNVELSTLIKRTGQLLKNKEWFGYQIVDLSTMPNDNIFIRDFSNGNNFSTNVKTVNNLDLLYGSIRPYFKKAGFNWKTKFIAGSVYSFNVGKKDDYLWILACICSEEFHKYTSNNSQGTKMPIINWETFIKYQIPYSKEAIIKLNQTIKPLFDEAVRKLKENDCLKNIKYKLLQKYF